MAQAPSGGCRRWCHGPCRRALDATLYISGFPRVGAEMRQDRRGTCFPAKIGHGMTKPVEMPFGMQSPGARQAAGRQEDGLAARWWQALTPRQEPCALVPDRTTAVKPVADDGINHFKGLSRLEPGIKDLLVQKSMVMTAAAGTVIFRPGKSPQNLLWLLDGVVRVQQVSEAGREIVLYRVEAGQSCVLTTTCMLSTRAVLNGWPRWIHPEALARSGRSRRICNKVTETGFHTG
jgi:hypothetical protein